MANGMIKGRLLACITLGLILSAPALAEKPEWAGKDKGKHEQRDKGGKGQADGRSYSRDDRQERAGSYRFRDHDHDRIVIQNYYRQTYSSSRCPPGLSKKGNGCMPPGLAKKWTRGRPLPRDVVYYDLPPAVVVEIGAPPAGHRYVRVASDILMIAIGTGMVVDAIEDLRW